MRKRKSLDVTIKDLDRLLENRKRAVKLDD